MSDERSQELASKLDILTEASIDKLMEVLALPVDAENGASLRAQTSAANTGLNTQLRADAMRLRALREDKALVALLALIATQERIVPPCPASDAARVVDSGTVSADVVP
jgi:hypothetical protein